MKNCANCHTPLLAMDQFGPVEAPLCRACYFNANQSHIYDDPEDEIRALQGLITRLQADIQAEGYRVWKLQSLLLDGYSESTAQESDRAKDNRATLIQKQDALIGRRDDLVKQVKAAQDAEIENVKESA